MLDLDNVYWDAVNGVYTTSLDIAEEIIDNCYTFLSDLFGSELTGDTEIAMPVIVSGIGSIRWVDSTGYISTQTGTFFLSNKLSAGQSLFSAGGLDIVVIDNPNYSGGTVLPTTLTAYTSGDYHYSLSPSNVFYYDYVIDGSTRNNQSSRLYAYSSSVNVPAYSYASSSSLQKFGFRVVNASFSNSASDKNALYNLRNAGQLVTPNSLPQTVVNVVNERFPDDTISVEDIPTFDEWQEQPTTEQPTDPTEPATDGNGNIIINNYDNTTFNADVDISGNADIDVNGAVDITAEAGAFGAGAFGAGAFGYADIDLNLDGDFALNLDGSLDVAEITLNGNATSYTVDSGATLTVTNNNFVIESGASIELPSYPAIDFTLDYDEILSEKELETILSQGDYEIETVAQNEVLSLELETFPEIAPIPEKVLSVSATTLQQSNDFLEDIGLSAIYAPLSVVLIACFILRGGK